MDNIIKNRILLAIKNSIVFNETLTTSGMMMGRMYMC